MVVCKVVSTALLRAGQLFQQLDHQRVTEAKLTVDVCTCTEGGDQVVGAGVTGNPIRVDRICLQNQFY